MNSFGITLCVALLVLGVTSALPNQLMSSLKDMPDLTQAGEHDDGPESQRRWAWRSVRTSCTCVRQPPTAARRKTENGTAAQESAATSWDSSGIAAPHSHPNASGGVAGLNSRVVPN
ncbi:hypothetical protein CEXT_91141 [Caerostris extrusa]|uniref:Uncharacterized protein n=1 Tax=Caerostris extrusa TaxID=172846 RepID=A0AAV4SFT6_CAEEX|nr:hypothetical protein CEXT_91141 [Caerostris extrusa]